MARHATWDLREGDAIGSGRHVVRLLGGGNRYEAYLVFDDGMHCLVVAKALRPDRAGDPRSIAALALEHRLLERVRHPAIVRSFGLDLEGERPHAVLEFLDGPRLSTLVRRHGVAVEQALSLGLQLCAAAHRMHGRGIVHLDLKPRNVIMAGPPRVIDLSVARRVDGDAPIDGGIGTARYMAPEQCDPDRFGSIGPAADMWGIGVTLHEALAGRPAFPRVKDGPAHPQLHADAPMLEARLRVPAPAAELIGACMERRPGDRPTAREAAGVLERLVDDLPPPRLGLFRPGRRAAA